MTRIVQFLVDEETWRRLEKMDTVRPAHVIAKEIIEAQVLGAEDQ